MIDRIDMNMQALGVLAHAVNDTARNLANVSTDGYQPVRTVIDSGPAYINAVTEHTYVFGQTSQQIPYEIANDQKTQERAWQYPYMGGNVEIAHEMAGLMTYERAFQANAQAIRTIEQTSGSVMNLFA